MARPVKRQKCFGPRRGVTLIEMLIVVAIAGAMAMVALPAFSNGLDNLRLSQASDSTAAFINGALNRAERRQQVMEITVSTVDNQMTLRSADGAFSRQLRFPEGVRLDAVLPKSPGDTLAARHILLFPGAAAPRFGVQLANRRGSLRIVTLDPITGVPKIGRPENP
ncbi:MAG TPA: prepilin-type N-terminal cleavage/methylation domain-containing protein [Bryobacteraceae bacterium]|jgi:prepilin-type N-terminal cleavage/methylation domain-containing protein|nr:prepilin-type N-terminal cleavage/methylation domain-containing protein [Bryobacteraceae bacterium]